MGSELAFMFPGQGSQFVGMGKTLCDEWAPARRYFEEADDVCAASISRLCFDGPIEELTRTQWAQPAIFATSCACAEYARYRGLQPAAVAGHSLGEYSALVAARVCDFDVALKVVCERGRLMAEAARETDGMAAVLGLSASRVEEIVAGAADVWIANVNCPGQTVISGGRAAIDGVAEPLREAGAKRVVPLAVSGAFHTDRMSDVNARLRPTLDELVRRDAAVPVVMNATGRPAVDRDELLEGLRRQMTSPVLWEDSVRAMAGMGASVFMELGPGSVLKGLVRRCLPDAEAIAVSEPAALEGWGERTANA